MPQLADACPRRCVWSLLRCRTKGISSLLNTLEAALAALLVTLLGHEANCRRMMMVRRERRRRGVLPGGCTSSCCSGVDGLTE